MWQFLDLEILLSLPVHLDDLEGAGINLWYFFIQV